MSANTTGSDNTAVGRQALTANTTASYNTAVGYRSLTANTTGATNVSVGGDSMLANTTGSNNVSLGVGAMVANTTGGGNVAIGRQALDANTTASNNTAVGYQSLTTNTIGTNNAGHGYRALYLNTEGSNNTALGAETLAANTTAANNTAVGYFALTANTTGAGNVAIGDLSLDANINGSNSVAVGSQAGSVGTSLSNCVFVGRQAGLNCTGDSNTFLGRSAGENITSGTKNTILGRYNGNQGGLDIRTSDNYIVLSDGDGNPRQVIDSSGNVGIGESNPLSSLHIDAANGAENFIRLHDGNSDYGAALGLGSAGGFVISTYHDGTLREAIRVDRPTGNVRINNTSNATYSAFLNILKTAGTNATIHSRVPGTGPSSHIIFGSDTADSVGSIDTNGSGTSYNTSSDHRLKENVADMTGAIDRVKALAPKRFNFIADADRTVDGFLAHEAQAVVPEAVTGTHNEVDDDGNAVMQGIDQSKLVPLLTGALQEAIAKIETLEARVAALEAN
jgi:hypothetical protein